MAKPHWIKLYLDFLDDHKIGRLSDSAKLRFVQLMLLAGECDSDGVLTNGDGTLTTEDIAWRLRADPASLKADIESMRALGLIALKGGTITVTNYVKRQGPSWTERREQTRERVKKHRRNADVTRYTSVTDSNVTLLEEKRGEEKRKDSAAGAAESAQSRAATAAPEFRPPPTTSQNPPNEPVATATPVIPDAMRSMGAPPRKPRNPRRLTVDDEPRLTDPRIRAWIDVFGSVRSPHLAEIDTICDRVSLDDIGTWQATLCEWAASSWRLDNVAGMVERCNRNALAARHADARPAQSESVGERARRILAERATVGGGS